MGSISIYKKRSMLNSAWSSWSSLSGSNTIGGPYNGACVYSANVSMSSSEEITTLTLRTTLASLTTKTFMLKCYVYDYDPTGSGITAPPNDYIEYCFVGKSITSAGKPLTIIWQGLNFTDISSLYFWITCEYTYSSGDLIEVYHDSSTSNPPSVTGTFSARSVSLAISPTSGVTTGNSVVLTINGGGSSTLYAVVSANGTSIGTYSVANGTNSLLCEASWFATAGVTGSKTMTVSVTITGGSNEPTGTFTLTAGDAMKPTASGLSTELVQASSASGYPSTYIAGVSKCKVSASVGTVAGATVASAVLTYPGGSSVTMSYNSDTGLYEGTSAAITGDTTFTVTVTDSRGLSSSSTVSVSGVQAYTAPTLTINTAYRCDSSGTETSGGAYYRVRATASCDTSLSGNAISSIQSSTDGSNWTDITEYNGVITGALGGALDAYTAYTLYVRTRDSISGWQTKSITITGATRNVVITRSAYGTNVAIGMNPVSRDHSSVDLPAGGGFYVDGTKLTNGLTSSEIVNLIYPVGSIYMSVSSTSPATLFGGTWTRITGRFLLAATDSGSSGASQAAGNTGGSATRTLGKSNLPNVQLGIKGEIGSATYTMGIQIEAVDKGGYGSGNIVDIYQGNATSALLKTEALGSGSSFSILPPFLSVYVWKRTA